MNIDGRGSRVAKCKFFIRSKTFELSFTPQKNDDDDWGGMNRDGGGSGDKV